MKLSFNDVHLRLEDELSLVGQPIAAGLAIEAIEASSVKNTVRCLPSSFLSESICLLFS